MPAQPRMHLVPVLARRPTFPIALLLAFSAYADAADVFWQLNVANPPNHFRWSTPGNWSTGALPGSGDNVFVNANAGPELDINTSITNLTVQRGTIDTTVSGGAALNVTGTTDIQLLSTFGSNGIYAESGATFKLGTLANFSAGILHGTTDNELYIYSAPNESSSIQFKGAHVIENEMALYLQGNGHMLDQDSGLDALRDLAVNRGDIYIVFGGSLAVSGNFSNNAEGAVYMGNRAGGLNTFTVQGDFTNATEDAGLYIDSPASVTVNGNLTNYGYISLRERTAPGETASLTVGGNLILKSTGYLKIEGNSTLNGNGGMLADHQSGLDMGGQPNVNTLYTTKLQIKNGIEFRGAFLTGTGTIFADLIFTQGGSVFAPGHSPGQMVVNGSLAFDSPTHFKMEIGGHTAATEYDQVVQHSTGSGGVTLNGVLDLSFVNGFQNSVTNSDSFTILTSDAALTGAFTNVANGALVNTADGAGSFRVDYSGTSIVLSEFQIAPPPVITSIPFETTPNRYITVLGVGLLGVSGANVNGLSTFASSVSDTEAQVYVPGNATSGPVTVMTNHGNATSSSSLTILADADSDGMSDAFEQQYFGSSTEGDPNADSDGDGLTNYQEFLAGTDPTSGGSTLRAQRVARSGNDVVITFPSIANKRYRIQASPSLTSPVWTDLAILPALGASGARAFTDANGVTQGRRFYQIQIVQ